MNYAKHLKQQGANNAQHVSTAVNFSPPNNHSYYSKHMHLVLYVDNQTKNFIIVISFEYCKTNTLTYLTIHCRSKDVGVLMGGLDCYFFVTK